MNVIIQWYMQIITHKYVNNDFHTTFITGWFYKARKDFTWTRLRKQNWIRFLSKKSPVKCPSSWKVLKRFIQNCALCLRRVPHHASMRWFAVLLPLLPCKTVRVVSPQKHLHLFDTAIFRAPVCTQPLWTSFYAWNCLDEVTCNHFRIIICGIGLHP